MRMRHERPSPWDASPGPEPELEPESDDDLDDVCDLSGHLSNIGFTARIFRDGVEVEIYVPLTIEAPAVPPIEPTEELSESPLDEDPRRIDPRGGSRGDPN